MIFRPGLPTFVMCSNATYQRLTEKIADAGIEVESIIDNVGQVLEQQRQAGLRRVKRQTATMNWDNYQRSVDTMQVATMSEI